MPIVQVLFVCIASAELTLPQLTAAFEMLQLDCHSRKIGGFFVAIPGGFVGLFEAEESVVLGQIEQIVRSRNFQNIEVIREIAPKIPSCDDWRVSRSEEVCASAQDFLSPEYLAEFIGSALKPFSKRPQQ